MSRIEEISEVLEMFPPMLQFHAKMQLLAYRGMYGTITCKECNKEIVAYYSRIIVDDKVGKCVVCPKCEKVIKDTLKYT